MVGNGLIVVLTNNCHIWKSKRTSATSTTSPIDSLNGCCSRGRGGGYANQHPEKRFSSKDSSLKQTDCFLSDLQRRHTTGCLKMFTMLGDDAESVTIKVCSVILYVEHPSASQCIPERPRASQSILEKLYIKIWCTQIQKLRKNQSWEQLILFNPSRVDPAQVAFPSVDEGDTLKESSSARNPPHKWTLNQLFPDVIWMILLKDPTEVRKIQSRRSLSNILNQHFLSVCFVFDRIEKKWNKTIHSQRSELELQCKISGHFRASQRMS